MTATVNSKKKANKFVIRGAKEEPTECGMNPTDAEGKNNLCCCYILNQDGQYSDPCDLPADNCCR